MSTLRIDSENCEFFVGGEPKARRSSAVWGRSSFFRIGVFEFYMNEKYRGIGVLPGREVPVPELPGMFLVVPRADVLHQLADWAGTHFHSEAVPRGQLELAYKRAGLSDPPASGTRLAMPVVLRWRNNYGLFDYAVVYGQSTVAELIGHYAVHDFTCVVGPLDHSPSSSLQLIKCEL